MDWATLNPAHNLGEPKDVTFTDARGAKQRRSGIYVLNPDTGGWFDANTWERLPGDTTVTSPTEPKRYQIVGGSIYDFDAPDGPELVTTPPMTSSQESNAEARDAGLNIREAGLAVQQNRLSLEQNKFEFEQRLKTLTLGLNRWSGIQSNYLRQVGSITREAEDRRQKALLAAPGTSQAQKNAAVQEASKWEQEQIGKLATSQHQDLATITKETGLTFDNEGQPQANPDKAKPISRSDVQNFLK